MSLIKKCIINKDVSYKPIWLMRQAGRYLPEFREIRKKNQDFINLCLNTKLVPEITLQPIKRFDLDAAIIFSDILMIPYGFGQSVVFNKGLGPELGIIDKSNLSNINEKDFKKKLDPIYNSIKITSKNEILKIKNNEIFNMDLLSKFPNNEEFKVSIRTNQNKEKITTIFTNYANPLVKKYKFIKGFEGGSLDFYSIKKNKKTNSNLKLYDFKLNEVPALTKLLTLASLQGIADLLTGEGIRFNEFEMKFNKDKGLMTIEEIYSLGPSISVLMEGYVQKDDLISLRGTLVPATTVNKVIGSIPLLGDILVGKKAGEGVFGVSFKIKGYPKDLKTTVNPIKTLTPRFITRTLEKLKKTN